MSTTATAPTLPGFEESGASRRGDSHTSKAAASAVRIGELHELCLNTLRLFREEGLTSEQIAELNGVPLQSITPRLSPLAELGYIRREGTRPGKSGRNRIVWHLVS